MKLMRTGFAAVAVLALWASAAGPSLACTPKTFAEVEISETPPEEQVLARAYYAADDAGDTAASEIAAQRWLDYNLRRPDQGGWFTGVIAFNLGMAQGAQKKDAEAARSFSQARDILTRTRGADSPHTLEAGMMLSIAQFKQGRFAEARATARAVSKAYDATACPDSDSALGALRSWGQIAGNGEADPAEAAQAWGEYVTRRLRRFGEADPELADAEFALGNNLMLSDRAAEALPLFVRLATRLEAAGGAKTEDALNARVWEVEALLELGRFAEAEERAKTTMAAARRADPKALVTIDAEDIYLRVLLARGAYDKAPEFAEDVLRARTRAYGEQDARTLSAAANAASLYETLGQVETAERLRRMLLDAAIREDGPDSEMALTRSWRLADLMVSDGRATEAEAFLGPIWRRIEKGPTTETLIFVGDSMGLILRAQERAADAESLYRVLRRRSTEALGERAPATLNVINNLAIVLGDTGRSREAEALHREVWEARKAVYGPSHPTTLASALNTARAINDPERIKERITILFEAQAAFGDQVSAAQSTNIAILNTLTDDLARVGRADAAEMLLIQVRGLYMTMYGADHPRTRSATLRLARVYGRQEKHAQAEPLFAELVALETRTAVPGLPPTGDMIAASAGLGLSRTLQGRAREGYPSLAQSAQAVYVRSRDRRTVGSGSEESRRLLIDSRYVFNGVIRAGWAFAHEP